MPVTGVGGAGAGAGAGAAAGAGAGAGMNFGAGAGLSLIGTLMGAWGQHQAGKWNKKLLDYNAAVAEWQAKDAIDRGVVLAGRRREQTAQVIAGQRAGLAHQGVDINAEGSAVDVQGNSRYLGELDAITIMNNAKRESYGFKIQATDLSMRGQIMQRTADMGAASTVLTGSSNLMLAQYGYGRGLTNANPLLPTGAR